MDHESRAFPRPARTWPVYVVFCLCLLSVGLASLVFQQAFGTRLSQVELLIGSLIVTAAVLLWGTLWAVKLSPRPALDALCLRGPLPGWKVVVTAALGAPALGTFLDSCVRLAGVPLSGSLLYLETTIQAASSSELAILTVVISLGPAVGEELLVRGYIQTRLVERWGAVRGVGIASFLFGIMHLDTLHSPLAAVLGLYLGALVVRFGTLWLTILVHATNNLFAVLVTGLAADVGESPPELGLLAALSLMIFLACGAFLLRKGALPAPAPEYDSVARR